MESKYEQWYSDIKLLNYTMYKSVIFKWLIHRLIKCFDLQVTGRSLLDYNRARSYLSDIANRASIPVFDNITEAVVSAVEHIKVLNQETEI